MLKKIKGHLKEWALSSKRNIRNGQIVRAENLIANPSSTARSKQNDPKRFISTTRITVDGY